MGVVSSQFEGTNCFTANRTLDPFVPRGVESLGDGLPVHYSLLSCCSTIRNLGVVSRNLSELDDLGLPDFEGGGPGKAKRPVIENDDIPLGTGEETAPA
jgi:hypothetical protein